MVVHMHNELANLVLKQHRLDKFWNWLSKKIETFNVQVLMGDFNMSLFRVIPELRSRGAVIDLGAWYPWKSLEGEPMSDSQGIFFVNLPGVYTLSKNLGHLHDRDETGILARGEDLCEDFEDGGAEAAAVDSAVAETGEGSGESEDDAPKPFGGFDRIEEDAGPGMRLERYLPKSANLTEKFSASLTPTPLAAVAAPNKDRKNDGIRFKEKRLSAKIWRCKGEHQNGSHFPICVFTNNVGRRSPEKLEERRQKQMQRSRRGPQWWAEGSQEGCRARTQDADLQQGWQSRPRGDFRDSPSGQHPVVEVWPRGRLDRWKEQQAQSDRRTGRRGARPPCSQASGERWIPVLGEDPWSAWNSSVTAAVAAAGPIGGLTPWWPPEGLTTSEPSPGECLRSVAAAVVDAPRYVELKIEQNSGY